MSEIKVKMGTHKEPASGRSVPEGFKPEYIGEFLLTAPMTTKHSGNSKWGFCQKDGTEYFIKEFLAPKYPDEDVDLSAEIKNKLCKACNDWFAKKQVIYNKICEAANGNIIAPYRFFKHKSFFYIVTEKVPPCSLTFESVRMLPPQQKHILMKVITACFSALASKGIVHSDMKPENILFKSTLPYQYTAKIIDFDASYLASDPPFGDNVQGTPEYYAPESLLASYSKSDLLDLGITEDIKLTPKVDVFALGIIFHEMLCGEKPGFDNEFTYVHEAVLCDAPITLNPSIPRKYREIIGNMLKKDASERWSAAKVFNHLSGMTEKEMIN
ncbi:MAG: protein kinase [Ruminococcus sp.]|nr:protein kinase [Ruminococcus sp.]